MSQVNNRKAKRGAGEDPELNYFWFQGGYPNSKFKFEYYEDFINHLEKKSAEYLGLSRSKSGTL